MRTTLAQLLARRGVLPPALALELVDQLAVLLASGPCDAGRLVELNPAAIELELVGERPAAVTLQVRPSAAAAATGPYIAWPELGRELSGTAGADPDSAGGEPAAVYCLGVLLYSMLEGRAPFSGSGLALLATRHLHEAPPRLGRQAVSPALEEVLWRALAKRREARFQSIAGLRQAIERVRSMPAAAPPAAAPPEAVGLFPQRGDRCVSLGGLGLAGPDGSREIRIGRSEPRTGHTPDVDLSDEPFGWRVQRRQAILRYGAAGWTVEEWIDADDPREGRALSTRVNGAALSPGERRPLSLGDALAFGPVRMRLDRLAAVVQSASGPVGDRGRTPQREKPAAPPPRLRLSGPPSGRG